MAAFGLGFGLTVTPRSTAAVEALGRAAFGVASATVTVARMVGMSIGLAALTAFGSTTIDRLSREIYATPESYRQFIPEALRDRPLRDGLVVQALEEWASGEAARILVGIFLVAAVITAAALVPALALGRRRMLEAGVVPDEPAAAAEPGGVDVTSPAAGAEHVARITVAAFRDGAVQEWTDAAALQVLEGGLLGARPSRPADPVWIDLAAPGPEQVARVAELLGLHPLIAEDIVEGNQRSKIEATNGLVHIVMFALDYGEEVAVPRGRPRRSATGSSSAPTRRAGTHGPARTSERASPRSCAPAPTISCGRSVMRSSMPTSRSPTGSRTPSTRSRTTSSSGPTARPSPGYSR